MNSSIATLASRYEGPAKTQFLYNIASNSPQYAKEVETLIYECPLQSQHSQTFISTNSRSTAMKKKTEDELNEYIEELQNLETNETAKIQELSIKVREVSYLNAIDKWSDGEVDSARSAVQLYIINYPNNLYEFRDLERNCFLNYLCGRYETICDFIRKISPTKGQLEKLRESNEKEEVISFFKIHWIILMAQFQLKNYQKVNLFFQNFKSLNYENICALSVLENCFVSNDGKNCDNFLTKFDILSAIGLSTLICYDYTQAVKIFKLPIMEDLFEEIDDLQLLIEYHYNKKYIEFAKISEKVGEYFKFGYNITFETYQTVLISLNYQNTLFFLVLIDKISLKDLSGKLFFEKEKTLEICLNLIKLLNLNLAYDPVEEVFEKIEMCDNANVAENLKSISINTENFLFKNIIIKALNSVQNPQVD